MIRVLLLLHLLALSLAAQPLPTRFPLAVPVLNDLLIANPTGNNTNVLVSGMTSANDGHAGFFQWTPGSLTPADGTNVFESLNPAFVGQPGRWKRLLLEQQFPPTAPLDTGGFITNYSVVTVRSIPELKNINVTNGIQAVIVRGYYDPNDEGEGTFVYDALSVLPEDGGKVVAPNNGPGNWIRVVTPATVYASWFGVPVTNGTLQIAINYASLSGKGRVILPATNVVLDFTSPIIMRSRVTVEGQSGTRVIAADFPSTNYEAFRFSGVDAASLQNMVLTGWINPPGGNTNNTGYGVTMVNVTNCVLGGIKYEDFYSQPVGFDPASAPNNNKLFDENWTLNSLKAYGAIGDGLHNDSGAVISALSNRMPGSGSKIIVTPGRYAFNAHLTDLTGVTLESQSQGGQGLTNYMFVPWDPALPILTFGTNSSVPNAYPIRSITLRGLMFDYRGPSYVLGSFPTFGKVGLSIRGGVESVYLDNCEWQGFSERGVDIVGGTTNNAGVENITFNNPNIQVSTDSVTTNTVGLYTQYSETGAASDLTFVTIFGGKFNGARNGAIIKDVGVHVKMFGGYIDGYAPNMIVLTNLTANYYPQFEWFGTTWDNHNGGYGPTNSFSVISNEFTGSFPWNGAGGFHEGTAEISWNSKKYPAYNWMLPATNGLYNPLVIGTVRFTVPGDYYEAADNYFANDSSTNLIANSGHSLIWTHAPGGTFQAGASTNAALTVRELITSYDVMTVTITNLPTDGVSTFVIGTTNNFPTNRVWVSVVTDPTYQVLIGADTNVCATNFYNQIIAFPYTNLLSGISLSSNIVTLTSGIGSGLTNASTTGWSTITNEHKNLYGISTWLQHAGVSRIIPGGEFRIDDPAADRIFSITTNAVADSIRLTSTGVGINQTAPAYPLTIRGNQSVVNGTEVSLAVTETNLSGSRAAMVIQQQFHPTGVVTNTTTAEALSIEGGTSLTATNAATAESLRIAFTHRSPNYLTNAVMLHLGAPAITGGGAAGTFMGLQIENVTGAGTNYSLKTGQGHVKFGDTSGIELNTTVTWTSGSGAPAADAPIGSIYTDTSGGIGTTFWVKEVAGAGASNWKAK